MPLNLVIDASEADQRAFDDVMRRATGHGRLDITKLSRPDAENHLAILTRMLDTGRTELGAHHLAAQRNDPVRHRLGFREPNVLLDLVDDSAMNACVVPRGVDSYWIGVTSGLNVTLTSIYNSLFRHKNLFANIGDAAAELHEGPVFIDRTGGYSSARLDHHEIEWEPQFPDEALPGFSPASSRSEISSMGQPIDPFRLEAYAYCIAIAWDAIISHELAHILNGHLAVLKHIAPASLSLFETPTRTDSVPHSLVRQALEIEADSSAAGALLARWNHSGNMLLYTPGPNTTNDPSLHLRLWFIATNALYWAFAGTMQTNLAQFDGMSHPHPDVRLSATTVYLHTVWRQTISRDRLRVLDDVWPTIVEDTVGLRQVLHTSRDQLPGVEKRRFLDPTYRAEIGERLNLLEEAQRRLDDMLTTIG